MNKPVTKPKSLPIVDSVLASTLEAKRAELDGVKMQLEFQLNGIINQLHLIKQLLQPTPPPAPVPVPESNNTI